MSSRPQTTASSTSGRGSFHEYVTTWMTLDAKGTGMTLRLGICSACQSPREPNDRDFVRVGLHRGCDAVNTNACVFGSTLALHQSNSRRRELRRALCNRNK